MMQNRLDKLIICLQQKAQSVLVKLFERRRCLKIRDFMHVYSPGAREPPGTKLLLQLKVFATLIIHCKF